MILYEQISAWKISLVFLSNLHLILTANLRCYRDSFTNFVEVPIEDPSSLINSSDPCVDVCKDTIMFVFGYMGNPQGFAVSALIPAFLTLGHNVLLVDWRRDASGGFYGPLLGYPFKAAPGTEKVGKNLGKALLKLIDMGMNDNIHLVGHSLGAHLAGYAGRETQEGGFTIPWITALDPAGLKFETPAVHKPIDSSCASFVDAVHCDPSGYAMNSSVGHVDFWPNYHLFMNGAARLQPGCERFASPLDVMVNGMTMNPLSSFELLFFAVFGQTTTEQTRAHRIDSNMQPSWTNYLFKIVFGIYMLVSVVVLINLLIAMMSDTYQRIQAQSDIEWKYGLSKLIRNMHRTNTAPSPLNLVTTWLMWIIARCKERVSKKKRPSLVHMIGLNRPDQMSARSKAGAKWLSKVKRGQVVPKDSTRLSVVHLSPLGSQMSFNNMTRIENVVDWEVIAKKYRALMRDEPEEPLTKENEADAADNVSEVVPNNVSAAP